jgi:hypothetical protein
MGISWRAEYALSAVDEGSEICDILCSFCLSILLAGCRKGQGLNYSPAASEVYCPTVAV